jgi:6,7-dimethyl-8-ribityllumazine synthase
MRVINEQNAKIHFNVAIVVSRFNEDVSTRLFEGAKQRLQALGFVDGQITAVWVPGAVEIPLLAQRLAQTKSYAAIICLGAVIRGETGHYDYVCEQVSQGSQRVALENNLPVIFGVLTTENEEQAHARADDKGRYAADAAVEMVAALKAIEELH